MAKLVLRITLGHEQRMERWGGNGLANSAIHGQHGVPGREEAETHIGRDCGIGIIPTTGTSIHPSAILMFHSSFIFIALPLPIPDCNSRNLLFVITAPLLPCCCTNCYRQHPLLSSIALHTQLASSPRVVICAQVKGRPNLQTIYTFQFAPALKLTIRQTIPHLSTPTRLHRRSLP
jgi:hypothetical protein